MSIAEQVRQAKRTIRQVKQCAPWVYGEWQRLQRAEKALRDAEREVEEARAAWERLGNE